MYALRERRVHVTQEDFEMAVTKVILNSFTCQKICYHYHRLCKYSKMLMLAWVPKDMRLFCLHYPINFPLLFSLCTPFVYLLLKKGTPFLIIPKRHGIDEEQDDFLSFSCCAL